MAGRTDPREALPRSDRYVAGGFLGKGTHGSVWRAEDRHSRLPDGSFATVAIKTLHGTRDPRVHKRRLREALLLQHLNHPNVLKLKGLAGSPCGHTALITACYATNLHRVIVSEQSITVHHRQYLSVSILRGLAYLHDVGVVHRDIKPENMLLNRDCDLVIGDLGLARYMPEEGRAGVHDLTWEVVTQWYRSPELLRRERYSSKVDTWAAGCILAEMVARKPLFPADCNAHHLALIGRLLHGGTPSVGYLRRAARALRAALGAASDEEVDLLARLLHVDPSERCTALQALHEPFLLRYHLARPDPVDDGPCTMTILEHVFEAEA